MTQLLAIEWDAREVRVAIARARGKEAVLESAFAIPLASRTEDPGVAGAAGGGALAVGVAAGERIAAALRERGLGKLETIVSVGRAHIELKQFSVPNAPEDELPEIVRFQSMRQFTTFGDDWPLDFVRLGGGAEVGEGDVESINVLAATISPDLVRQIRETCDKAGLHAKRLVLRPFAAASLVRRRDRDPSARCRLMVDILTEEADLTVIDDQALLLTRTVRLHGSETNEAQARGVLGEIRRTIAAASNQLGGRRVEKVILCGDGTDHAALKQLVEQELNMPAELFDPFAQVRLTGQRPKHSGRFAPLLGMLRDEAAGVPHAIDFLHPRKKPERVDLRKRYALIGGGLAAACALAFLLVWWNLTSLDADIELIQGQISAMKGELAIAEAKRKDEMAIQEFLNHRVNWLDEMEYLAQRLPPPEDALLTQLNMSSHPPLGIQMKIEGFTREATKFKEMEEALRVGGRTVASDTKANDLKREKYQIGFAETIKVPMAEKAAELQGESSGKAAGKSKSAASPVSPGRKGDSAL